MVHAIVVSHGEFARAIVSTVEGIVGKQDNVDVVTNRGVSCEQLSKRIAALISDHSRDNTIIFLDLPGGSCTISCYQLLKDMPDLNIISGVNLPMLIEFFMLRDKHTAQDLIPILINKGKDNIIQLRCRT
jgi:mannose/fructose/sorbose-specific phosphotransferase system IIA component